MMQCRPFLRLLLQRIQIVAPDETPLHEPTHAMQCPCPTVKCIEGCRGLYQAYLIDPCESLYARGPGIAEADAQRDVKEEGLHDAVVRRAVTYPTRPHLLHIELVTSMRGAVVVKGRMEALGGITIADEEEEVDGADLEARIGF